VLSARHPYHDNRYWEDSDDHTIAIKSLEAMEVADLANRDVRTLSGGERQRVAIARALVRNRPVLLLDEAFASLGPALRQEMLDLVGNLQEETGMTVVIVTHHPEDALRLPSTLFFLENGKIVASGPAKELLSEKGPSLLRKYLGAEDSAL
jgi:thiamine transport system ATP-binding protein